MLWFSLYPLYPGGPPDNDELKYPVLYSFIRVFNELAAGVDNNNRQTNIKLDFINTKIPCNTVSIIFEIGRLYNFCRVCAFESQFINKATI